MKNFNPLPTLMKTKELRAKSLPSPTADEFPSRFFIKQFKDITIKDIPTVGGKTASLGEMFRELASQGVPDGFATTATAYWHFLETSGLASLIDDALSDLDIADIHELQARSAKIRGAIVCREASRGSEDGDPRGLRATPCPRGSRIVAVAVRSSATAEDLPDASFAGAQETFLNVVGEEALLQACLRCYASLFYERAISYRVDKGFRPCKVALSIGVQRMVRSDLGTSGVMFTLDTESGFRDAVLINAAYGLGENIVKGSVTPDEYCVFKTTLRKGFRPILQKIVGSKEVKMIYDTGAAAVKNVPVPQADRMRFALNDDDILKLARWACLIEEHYGKPMDIEWAKDGITGELFIVQARPETVESRKDTNVLEIYRITGERGKSCSTGSQCGRKNRQGPGARDRDAASLRRVSGGRSPRRRQNRS